MTHILNRPAKLLVVPEPLSFACPVIDFATLAEAASYAAERLQDAHVVWALTPEGRNLTREKLERIHRASQKRRHAA